MTVEQLFSFKTTNNDDDDLILEFTKRVLGALPTNKDGEIDWRETGCILGDQAKDKLNSLGVAVSDPAQANRVLIGTALSAGKALYEKRDKYLNKRQQRDLTMLLGFLEATGCFNKLASLLLNSGFKE